MNGVTYAMNLQINVVTIHDGMYLIGQGYHCYIQISGAADDLGYGVSGTEMEMQYLNSGAGKRWNIESLENGYYKIISADSGLALAVTSDNVYGLNAAIVQEPYTGAANQQWSITCDATYIIKARSSEALSSNLVLSLPYDLSSDGEYSGYQVKQGVYNEENSRWNLVRMLPTSGDELEYDEETWAETVGTPANCYSYAINNRNFNYEGVTFSFLHQPGDYIGNPVPKEYSDYEVYAKEIVKAVIKDFEAYNLDHGTSLICKEIGKYDVCPEGTYKIALVVGHYPTGFHWYRQDKDGFWSNKNGTTPITRFDLLDRMIVAPDDPAVAKGNRYFIAYLAVSPWQNDNVT